MTAPLIDLNDPKFDADRFTEIETLRRQHPFARTKDGAIVFFSQDDAIEVLACNRFRFAFNLINAERSPYLANAIENELLNMHGTQHARLSRLLKIALRDRVFDNIQTTIHTIVDDLIDDLLAHRETDFCATFADPLPARILGPMFGVPYDDVAGLNDWIKIGGRKIDALQSGLNIGAVEGANRNIHGFLRELIEQRRKQPGDDLFSELMLAEIDGDRMSDDEVVYLAGELASAGVDTTRAQLPLILLSLLRHPTEMNKLRSAPNLALRAVDEGMRFAPLPWALPHTATTEFTYKGISFKTGDLAFVLVPAANRDPTAMSNPEEFQIDRDRVRHFSFGGGMHSCPGAQLARMEMSIALKRMMDRSDQISLLGDPVWVTGQRERTLESLSVRVS